MMSVPSAPPAPYVPPYQFSNDSPPEYTDVFSAETFPDSRMDDETQPLPSVELSTESFPVSRVDEETHRLPSIAESPTRKACKMMCVTTNSALMVIAWTISSTLFSGIGAYWIFSTLPIFYQHDILLLTFYPMSAALVIALLLSPVFAVAGDVGYGTFCLMMSVTLPLNVIGLILATGIIVLYVTTDVGIFSYFPVFGYLLTFLAGSIFQANAILLGRSVLGDFESPERSALVHWYYWAMNTPGFCAALVLYATVSTSSGVSIFLIVMAGLAAFTLLILPLITCVANCAYLESHGWRTMLPLVKGNPFKQVFRVTQCALQTPATSGQYGFFSRLNSTRQSNGGQADDEEVDNVTKFWLLLLAMASLCGFFFWDDMWAVPFANAKIAEGNPVSYVLSSQATTSAIVFISVPIYQLIIRPLLGKRPPPILWRILVGLILQVISLAFVTWSVAVARSELGSQALSDACTLITSSDDSYDPADGNVGWFYLVLPQVINGFSQLLVFPAVLELILTDAPRVMQGLLIGIWYAMQSIHIIVSIVETVACLVYYWPYYIVKIVMVLASTITFAVIALLYKRRQVVNSVSSNTQGQGEVGMYQHLQGISIAEST